MKTKTKMKMKTKIKTKTKMETKTRTKMKTKTKTPRGLELPQTVNSLSYLAQKCHSIFVCEFSTWPSGAIDGQLSLDWPRSAIAPRNMAPSLIRLCRIQ